MDKRRKRAVDAVLLALFGDWLYAPGWKPGLGTRTFVVLFLALVLLVILGEISGGRW